jgi:carboxypeptidase M/carboxypeptidase D
MLPFSNNIIYFFVIIATKYVYGVVFGNHDYDSISALLNRYALKYPDKTFLYSIGKSVLDREMWVLAIADSNPHKHILLRPEVKLIGNTHVQVKENLIRLIDYMLTNQTLDSELDYIMKSMRVHVLLQMNPDGFFQTILADCSADNGRYNGNNFDLNKNFPDSFECQSNFIQPESQSIINWLHSNEFLLSANILGGTQINYSTIVPKLPDKRYDVFNLESDQDVFDMLISKFKLTDSDLKRTSSNCNEKIFYNEVTKMGN